jgi:hypothetical protein
MILDTLQALLDLLRSPEPDIERAAAMVEGLMEMRKVKR